MAGVRGVKNPVPTKGRAPTGIFSTRGSQKRDPLTGDQAKYAGYAGNKYDASRKGPVKRDNRLK